MAELVAAISYRLADNSDGSFQLNSLFLS